MSALLGRLMAKTTPGPNGCVIFTGSTVEGYGQIFAAGRRELTHRVAYLLLVGEIPEGMRVSHLCHTADTSCPGGKACLHRRCINRDHLTARSQSDVSREGHGRKMKPAGSARLTRRERDEQVAASRSAGDREAFAALYRRHAPSITGLVLTLVRDRNVALAEDLTAEAFIRAWRAWPKCRATTDVQRRAWLRTIVRHTVIDHYRVKANTAETAMDPTAWQYANRAVDASDTAGCYALARTGRRSLATH
ncbi:sigma factor [Streptomyces incanus]|uniref:Sigma factor n=1 Tax=Streptomyces incanus TaxID=887453 RepID=A0ABW0XPE3_9ACTN